MPSPKPNPVDAYIATFPAATQAVLQKIRATIRKAAPDAEESMAYGVGAFKRGGTYVIYYGGYAKHVAVYPVFRGDPVLDKALAPYSSGKATAKFMLDKPIPYGLIAKIVEAKVKENADRVAAKAIKVAKPTKAARKAPARKAAQNVMKKILKKKATRK